jgi:hypothetical protein
VNECISLGPSVIGIGVFNSREQEQHLVYLRVM